MGSNQYFKNKALASLEGNWGTAAIATLIIAVISGGISSAVSMPFGNDFVQLAKRLYVAARNIKFLQYTTPVVYQNGWTNNQFI